MSVSRDKQIIWRSPDGGIVSCAEKNKVMAENIEEIRQVCQDALDDAVLMGCDEKQVRAVLMSLIEGIEVDYEPQ